MTKERLLEQLENVRSDMLDMMEEIKEDQSSDQQTPKHSVFFMPFEDVHKMLDAGLIGLFHVGDQIVNQHKKYGPIAWDIIGINVDKRLDCPNTLTLLMHDVLPGTFVYSEATEKYPYGHAHYPTSDIRKWLNGDLLKGFSEDTDVLYMLEVEKATYTVNDEGAKEEVTADKLFLLSASEAGFALGDFVHDEGAVYPFFDGAPENRRKTEQNDPAAARLWWLRSPYPGNASTARLVYTSGAQGGNCAYYGYGAAAACVIG